MTIESLTYLSSPAGRDLLARFAPLANDSLALQQRLRAEAPAEVAMAAAELLWLRRKAVEKFPSGMCQWFDREGFEQATSEVVAAYHARRFAGVRRIADLCTGIGSDALALAQVADTVTVDSSLLRCEMARLNALEAPVERAPLIVCADVERWVPEADFVFVDPSRRRANRRLRGMEGLSPPLGWCLEVVTRARGGAVKLSPMVNLERALPEAELEFISWKGECREQAALFGELRTATRRATVLPSGETITARPGTGGPCARIGAYLFTPDPAVARAHLSRECAEQFGLSLVQPGLEVLTGDSLVETALLRAYRVDEVLPLRAKAIRQRFRQLDVRPDILVRRGCRVSEAQLRELLPRTGERRCAVFFLRDQVVLSFLEEA